MEILLLLFAVLRLYSRPRRLVVEYELTDDDWRLFEQMNWAWWCADADPAAEARARELEARFLARWNAARRYRKVEERKTT